MERINQDIKTGQFSRLYLIYGDDEYYRTFARNKLKSALVSDDDIMNLTEFSGKDVDVNSIMDTARTIPFLAERRVVIVTGSELFNPKGKSASDEDGELDGDNKALEQDSKDAQKESGKKSKKEYGLAEFLSEIPDTTVLIFCEEKVKKTIKLYKQAEKNGCVICFEQIKENDPKGMDRLKRMVLSRIAKDNKKITFSTMELFLERTGTDLRHVFVELEKLLCYTLDKDIISDEDVKALIPERIEDRIFDMIENISSFKQSQALDLYYDLLRKKESPVKILSLIERHYNQLYIVKSLSTTGMSPTEILKRASIKPIESLYNKYMGVARRYSSEDLRNAMEMCLEFDKAFKSGKIKDNIAVEMVIVAMSSRERIDFNNYA